MWPSLIFHLKVRLVLKGLIQSFTPMLSNAALMLLKIINPVRYIQQDSKSTIKRKLNS